MVISRKKPKIKRDFKIYLNNKKLQQEDTIKYLGTIIERWHNFNEHTEHITGKCIKLIHALSQSAKINRRLRHEVLRIIYTGAILPILSYGAPVWIDCLKINNATQLKRVQRLVNIQIAQASRTTSYEALSVITRITPILIELRNLSKCYHITRGNEQDGLYDAPKHYRKWSYHAEAIDIKEKCETRNIRFKFTRMAANVQAE
jgi:hypothetical protein